MPEDYGKFASSIGENLSAKIKEKAAPIQSAIDNFSPEAPNPAFGNYNDLASLSRRQLRLANRANGKINYIDPGFGNGAGAKTLDSSVSWRDWRNQWREARRDRRAYDKAIKDYNTLQQLGIEVSKPEFGLSADAESIYNMAPNYTSVTYSQKVAPEPAAKAEAEPVISEPEIEDITYNYKGVGNGWDARNQAFLDAVFENGNENLKNFADESNSITDASLKKWQTDNGLVADSKFGWNSLGKASELGLISAEQLETLRKGMTAPKGHKNGGTIKMKYFQAGGAINAQQVSAENAQAQQQQLTDIFMAIAKNPKETLQALAKQGIQPEQIIDLVNKMADKNEAAQQAAYALRNMSQMAKQGTKLEYIKRLRGECPEGFELRTFKAGGIICTKCMKKQVEMDKCGNKMKNGGESEVVSKFKELRCGGKAKKKK